MSAPPYEISIEVSEVALRRYGLTFDTLRWMSQRHLHVLLGLVVLLSAVGTAHAEQSELRVWSIDPAASHVTVSVGRAGLFGFVGHPHEVVADTVAGQVALNPEDPASASVVLEIDAASLRVTGKDEPADDVPEVQRVMLSDEVLDVARFPTIAFVSREVILRDSGPDEWGLTVEGDLTVHGIQRPQRVQVALTLGADGLLARGDFTIKQTDFGIDPPGAAGGLVKSKDELAISFSLRAGPSDPR